MVGQQSTFSKNLFKLPPVRFYTMTKNWQITMWWLRLLPVWWKRLCGVTTSNNAMWWLRFSTHMVNFVLPKTNSHINSWSDTACCDGRWSAPGLQCQRHKCQMFPPYLERQTCWNVVYVMDRVQIKVLCLNWVAAIVCICLSAVLHYPLPQFIREPLRLSYCENFVNLWVNDTSVTTLCLWLRQPGYLFGMYTFPELDCGSWHVPLSR